MRESNAETIANYIEAAQKMSKDEFIAEFPQPFLVQQSVAPDEGGERGPAFMTSRAPLADLQSGARGSCKPSSALVFQIVKRGKNAFASMITVGRTASNDVAMFSTGVSKFHAFFSKDGKTGLYYLTDADSTNGTCLNGERLTPQEKNEVRDGDTVRFDGFIELKLYFPARFYARVLAIAAHVKS